MIIKRSSKDIKLSNKIGKIFKLIVNIFGYSFLTLFLVGIFYYYSSNLNKSYSPSALLLKINDKILVRYLGFNVRLASDYLNIIGFNLSKSFKKNNLPNVYLQISQKSILGLELQRKIKEEKGGPIPDNMKIWYPAKIQIEDEIYRVKIKLKGNRFIHWSNKKETSYKIDTRGDKRIWDLEEFSFQKPITKNYTYEYLFHKLLGYVGLTNIDYRFVNLFFNDQNLGVYALEESFSEDLLIRQNMKSGQIFTIRGELGELFPNIFFELYSDQYWKSEKPEVTKNLFFILNNIRDQNYHVNDYFDIDKWAKFFAIIDLTGAYHGSMFGSSKIYYNPETKLLEPIGYDLHKGDGSFEDFILADLLDNRRKPKCSWICDYKQFYDIFFKNLDGELNYEFLKKYSYYLKEYSSKNFIEKFLKEYENELNKYNIAIYQDNSKTDIAGRKGLGFFVYDEEYLFNRSNLIKKRIYSINLNEIDISKNEDKLIYEDYLLSQFPVEASTQNCADKINLKKFYFVGRMKINFDNKCEQIQLTDLNNNKLNLEIKNIPEINF